MPVTTRKVKGGYKRNKTATVVLFNCDFCGKEFNRTVWPSRQSKNRFCGRKCMGLWQSKNKTNGRNPINLRNWLDKNKEKINQQMRTNKAKKKKIIQDIKMIKGCCVCGYNKCVEALHFHHLTKDKEFQISTLSKAMNRVIKETTKCIVLCSNCHTELHYNLLTLDERYACQNN